MKREHHSSASDSPPSSPIQPTNPSRAVKKARPAPPGQACEKKPKVTKSHVNGTLEAEKRGAILDHIIATGYQASSLDDLCQRFALSKQQVKDQFKAGKKGNIRAKAVKAVTGERDGKSE